MKERSQWEVTRTLKLESFSGTAKPKKVETTLQKNTAIKKAQLIQKSMTLRITYDASKISLDEVLVLLNTLGLKRKESFWQDIKFFWYQYTDDNRKDYATSGPAACCNKAPHIKK